MTTVRPTDVATSFPEALSRRDVGGPAAMSSEDGSTAERFRIGNGDLVCSGRRPIDA